MKKIILLALFVWLTSQYVIADKGEQCNSQTHTTGLLWEINHPDYRPSYLFGTIHLEDSRITTLPSAVTQSLIKSEHFAMEVEIHPLSVTTYQERSLLTEEARLDQLLEKKEFSELSQLVEENYGLDQSAIVRLKPWAVFIMLGRPPGKTGRILDVVLAELALQNNLNLSGLETMDELLDELESLSLDDQLAILRDTVDNYSILETTIEELKKNYLDQNLSGMMAINQRDHEDELLFERFMEHLLYRRNSRMLKRMQPLLEKGRAFIAVGALHLTGERGLLCGLASSGYQLKRLY